MSFGTQMAEVRKSRQELDPADYQFIREYYVGPNPDLADMVNCGGDWEEIDAAKTDGTITLGCCSLATGS